MIADCRDERGIRLQFTVNIEVGLQRFHDTQRLADPVHTLMVSRALGGKGQQGNPWFCLQKYTGVFSSR